jgi:hypothetical protein
MYPQKKLDLLYLLSVVAAKSKLIRRASHLITGIAWCVLVLERSAEVSGILVPDKLLNLFDISPSEEDNVLFFPASRTPDCPLATFQAV